MWREVSTRVSPRLWLLAGVVSVLLLLAVLSQVDGALVVSAARNLLWPWFAAALLLLLLEGMTTALRMQVFTPGPPRYTACLRISAWYVVYLLVLPARLGEIVAVVLLKTYAGQSAGPGLANLLTQRLFDLLLLVSIFFVLAMLVSGLPLGVTAVAASLLLFMVFAALILWLDRVLGIAATAVRALYRRFGATFLRQVLRLLLQARMWRRHHATRAVMLRGLVVTGMKWTVNLGGLSLLFMALQIPVSLPQALLLAAAFNFLAIVPVQTIGGIGVSEVGLSALLVLFGMPLDYAASMSIVVRVVLLLTPALYWGLVMLLVVIIEPAPRKAAR